MSVKATEVLKVSNSTSLNVVNKQEHDQPVQRPLNASAAPVKINYYVPNMLRTLQENLDKIEILRKEINVAAQKLDPKLHHELLERNRLNNENFSKLIKAHLELKADLKNKVDDTSLMAELQGLVNEVFELYRQFYILDLDIRALKVDEFFKVDKDLKKSQEILREVYHTIQLHIPHFDEYFKHKRKTLGQTDYRVAIKWLSFKEESADKAVEALLANADFVNTKLGKEKVLVAEFSNLRENDGFNNLSRCISLDFNDAVMRHVFLPDKKCIIFFLKDFQAKRMDLHGCDSKMAFEHAEINVRNRFLQFNDFVILMTGKGNHSVSGKSGNKAKLLKQLERWRQSDKHFIKSFKVSDDGGSIEVEFSPVKSISVTNLADAKFHAELAQAIKNQEHRIIVKLDKKYPPRTLERIAIDLTIQVLQQNADLKVGSLFPKQSKFEDDNIRLLFTYPNAHVKLFEYNSDFNSLSRTTWPAITMAITAQVPKKKASQPKRADTAAAAITVSTATKVPATNSATANPILHSLDLKKAKDNQSSPKKKNSHKKTATSKSSK
jgi:hypothetical protein